MSKNTTLTLGVGFTLLGFLGYLSSLAPHSDDKALLLGQFSNSPVQTALYLATGLSILWCLKQAKKSVGLWVQVTGIVYTLLTIVSVVEKGSVLGMFQVNPADTLLFFAVAVITLTQMLGDGKDA